MTRTFLLILSFASTAVAARYRADFELPLKVFGHDGSWQAVVYLDDELLWIEAQHAVEEVDFTAVSRGPIEAVPGGIWDVPSQQPLRFIRYTLHFLLRGVEMDGVRFHVNGKTRFDIKPSHPLLSTALFEMLGPMGPAGLIFFKGFPRQEIGFSEVLVGDVNGDRDVDFSDFLVISANFGEEANSLLEGDLNFSGRVDFDDFLLVSSGFGNGSISAVPEPRVAFAWLLFVLTMIKRRKIK